MADETVVGLDFGADITNCYYLDNLHDPGGARTEFELMHKVP